MRYTEMVMRTSSEKETIALGEKLGRLLEPGMTVALKGDLAGGKTTFTKGIGKALEVKDVVNSPTFTILKIHQGNTTLFHIDAYRLENNEYDLGISELSEEGITVIEWPEYYRSYLPEEYLEVLFVYVDDNSREIEFIPHGEKYESIAKEMTC